ncbi:hypothetical protein M7775_13800, partial [Sporomusa sphaeroides DSM 2875]|uniref:hypothetical protein n=1 Tax=Sporomusa sphaeroides TaxID=47679 RepID=UPI00202EE6AB
MDKKHRKIGSTDICRICGNSYIVKSGTQKFCPDCKEETDWDRNNKEKMKEYGRKYYSREDVRKKSRVQSHNFYNQNTDYYREYCREHKSQIDEYNRYYYRKKIFDSMSDEQLEDMLNDLIPLSAKSKKVAKRIELIEEELAARNTNQDNIKKRKTTPRIRSVTLEVTTDEKKAIEKLLKQMRSDKKNNSRTCVICGTPFPAYPSNRKVTCSKECSTENKRRTHTGKSNKWSNEARQRKSAEGMTDNLKKGTPAAQASPIAGPFETNHNALIWVLESPEGEIYEVRNLALWLREHADMLDGTPEQAEAGIKQIKRSMEG